jgi:hypothetical protein
MREQMKIGISEYMTLKFSVVKTLSIAFKT